VRHDVAFPIGHVRTQSDARLGGLRVAFMRLLTVLIIELDAFKVLLIDEVHDTCDGVRTVHSGRATGQHFNSLDELRRNDVQIDRCGARDTGHETTAIDQHQCAVSAQLTQVDGRDTSARRCEV
jgi:hypothetical protein